jgi:hypothetical protein
LKEVIAAAGPLVDPGIAATEVGFATRFGDVVCVFSNACTRLLLPARSVSN